MQVKKHKARFVVVFSSASHLFCCLFILFLLHLCLFQNVNLLLCKLKRASKRYGNSTMYTAKIVFKVADEVLILLPTNHNKLRPVARTLQSHLSSCQAWLYKFINKRKTFYIYLVEVHQMRRWRQNIQASTPTSDLVVVCAGVVYAPDPDIQE